jgi:hypothetical protein
VKCPPAVTTRHPERWRPEFRGTCNREHEEKKGEEEEKDEEEEDEEEEEEEEECVAVQMLADLLAIASAMAMRAAVREEEGRDCRERGGGEEARRREGDKGKRGEGVRRGAGEGGCSLRWEVIACRAMPA